jgi:hypothetical protein
MSDDNNSTTEIAPLRLKSRHKSNRGMIAKGPDPKRHPGRPPGSLNKITRTMKDAAIAAAVELGQLDLDRWEGEIKKADPDGMKHYFKVLAVKEMKTFAIILGRIMPLRVATSANLPKYVNKEQMQARLREAGLPDNLVEFMRPVDARSLDPEDLGYDPYDDPEEDEMVDVTPPNKEAAE